MVTGAVTPGVLPSCRDAVPVMPSVPFPLARVTLLIAALVGAASGAAAQGPSPDQIRKALATPIPEDPATVVAVVGQSFILAGDLMPRVEARVKEVTAKSSQQPGEMELRYIRGVIFRSLLNQTIQLKILRESFLLSQVGTQSADKRLGAEKQLQAKALQMFHETELPRQFKKFGVYTVAEVDQKLREQGSSYESTKMDFIDQMLAHLYRSDAIPKDPEVTLIEVRNYYEDNIDQFQVKAQARWEQLTATFEKCGSREATLQAINDMGREAYFGGSMQAVARAKSQEPFAARGGVHDWTTRGSLASSKLEDEIYSLPLGVMSEVIEDEVGMHIVRVLERRPAGVKPISEMQDEIREKLKEQKIEAAIKKVTDEMTRRVPVWTIFPDDIEGSYELATTPAAKRR